jgi:type I restriction enzyme S subunit
MTMSKIKIEKYSSYKDSGVEWLGEIPQIWKILPSKRFHQIKKQPNSKRECGNVLSLTLRGVVNNDPDSPEGMVPKDYGTYQIFENGDLVFKLIDLENVKTSRVGIVHERGIMSSAYIRLCVGNGNFSKFAYYYFYCLYLNQVYNNLGSGVRSTLGPTDLLDIPYLEPLPLEQVVIANFLDRKTALIDQAVDIKQKQIELLKERRQILIHKAVTRGLNAGAKLILAFS